MRRLLPLLAFLFTISFFSACSDDATKPASSTGGDGTIHGQIHDTDFEFQVSGGQPGDPVEGPFILRGSHLHYNDEDGSLVVDLTVLNRGVVAQHEPIGLTFITLDPDGVTLSNPDNGINDDGAGIVFHFANDDNLWTPGEESLPRTVEFSVAKGTAIAFVARLELGAPAGGGAIGGRVWNDENKDGIMDASEGGLGGVGVYLYFFVRDINEPRVIRSTTTGREGQYQFDSVPAGGYVVSIAPSTVSLFPTTPTEIHVLLTEVDGDVSSYKNANFGAVRNDVPPPPLGEHVHALGKFAPPDAFASASVDHFECADTVPQPLVTDPPVNEDCVGGRLRGSVTEIAPERNAFRIMATWVMLVGVVDPPLKIEVGARLDVHVHQGPGPLAWVADSIAAWTGDHDEITGHVDAIEQLPDGTVRMRVLDTWVTPAEVGVGPR
jgi:hypothetical protein